MKCAYCNNKETKVIDKRDIDQGNRRRRECIKCGKRFTTYEKVETINLPVIKKNRDKEPFNRDKIKIGITKACEKRPISKEQIEKIIDQIESDLRKLKAKEIPSNSIGERIMSKLKKIDDVAYVRFASVYRSFADITDFQKELKNLVKK
jgi:transcriptional repressor NrdR